MKKAVLAFTITLAVVVSASAETKYWDKNGTTAGSGNLGGTWDGTTVEWNTDSTGGAGGVLSAWTVNTDTAAFSAGTDGIGALTIAGTATAGGLIIQEGTVEFTGTITMGGSPMTVESGAILSTNSSLRIATTAGSIVTLNNGTLRTTNAVGAGSFVDTDTDIVLNGGGTIDYPVANILNIIQTTTSITGSGPLKKTGVGVIAIASTAGTNTYTGGTIISDGELRMRTVVNTLPVTTAVTVNGPGIFNLNNVSTQIGSLTGTGNVGTGGGTLTIDGSASTTFDGAIKNLANAGANAVTSGNGRLVKSGSGTITFNGVNDINGSVTLNAGGIVVNASGSLCGDIADLNVNGGTLTLNQAAEKIENLAGTGGSIILNNAALSLITDPVASTSYAGKITGSGGLTRKNANSTTHTLTLTGNNDYAGNTIIDKGIIAVGSDTALGSVAGYTQVTATGAELLFTAQTARTVAEPLRIAGTGAADNGAVAAIANSNVVLNGETTLIGDATITASGNSTMRVWNVVSNSNHNLTLAGATTDSKVDGVISLGSGGLIKNQSGRWGLQYGFGNAYSGGTAINAGTLWVNNIVPGTSGTGSGDITIGSSATAATLEIGDGGAGGYVSGNITFTNTSNQSTVSFNHTGSKTHAASIAGANGRLVKLGTGELTLTAANSYGGGTTVTNGTLKVANTTGSATGLGAVTVKTGATLTGTGAVSGLVTIEGGGTFSPGNSPGVLNVGSISFNASSTFQYEIDTSVSFTSGADLVNVDGNVSIDPAAVLNITDSAVIDQLTTAKFTLISYSGTLTGEFASKPNNSLVNIGPNSFYLRYDDVTGGVNFGGGVHSKFVTLTAVPEASVVLFGAIVCLAFGGKFASRKLAKARA